VMGAGAIGLLYGGWLQQAGADVTFIARGANLTAIREHGLRVVNEDGKEVVMAASILDYQFDHEK